MRGGGLEQAAEVLLTGVVMGAFASPEVPHHFVLNFETFEMDDADELIALFPDLALLKP